MPGYRQNVAWENKASSESQPADAAECPNVVQELLLLWTLGEVSASAVQRLAHAVVLDGNRNEMLLELASIGAWGQNAGSNSKNLMQKLGSAVKVPKPAHIQVPCLDAKINPKLTMEEAGVLLPHDLFVSLAQNYPETFQDLMGLDSAKQFWDEIRTDDFHWTSEYKQRDFSHEHCIPCWLHGDAVEYADRRSLLVLSWGSLACKDFAPSISCLFAACFAKPCISKGAEGDTMDPIWSLLRWSFEALLDGRHPSRDAMGNPFAPGSLRAKLAGRPLHQPDPEKPRFRVVLWSIVGDYEFFANDLGLPHWMSSDPCGWCNASRKERRRMWNVFADHGWQCKKVNDYENDPVSRKGHPIFTFPMVHSLSVQLDVLHCLDLGVLAKYMGSILKQLVWHDMSDDPSTNLDRLWERLQLEYDDNCNSRLASLTLAMIVPNPKAPHAAQPLLKSKAAEARHLLPALTRYCRSHVPEPWDDCQKTRLAGLEKLQQWYGILEDVEFVPQQAQSNKLRNLLQGFLLDNEKLHAWATKKGLLLYEPVPKHHYAWHLGDQAKFLSPKRVWSYKNESYMGTMASIANSCSFGTALPRISVKIANKVRFMMHYHWSFRSED